MVQLRNSEMPTYLQTMENPALMIKNNSNQSDLAAKVLNDDTRGTILCMGTNGIDIPWYLKPGLQSNAGHTSNCFFHASEMEMP